MNSLLKSSVLGLFALLILAFAAVPAMAKENPGATKEKAASWSQVSADTYTILQKAGAAYELGRNEEAKKLAADAYFGPFEQQGMEAAIRLNVSAQRVYEFEERFREIRRGINSGVPPAEINSIIAELGQMLNQEAVKLDGNRTSSPYAALFNSFVIILREGLEAILVIGALTAYLVKSGNADKLRTINFSVVLALAASAVTAVLLKMLLSGAGQETLEGITMLIAVGVLFLVSFWMISNAQAKKWQKYIEGKLESSLTRGSGFALGFAAFLAVYREGAETALFYQALIAGNPPSALPQILAGLGLGLIALGIFYAVMRFGAVRIPLKPFFAVTGTLLYYLAFVFAGEGIKELQAAGVVGVTPISGMPVIGWLGVYPTWETTAIQIFLIAAYISAFALQAIVGKRNSPTPKAA